MSTLERAIEIAREAHAGQTDKAGAPYVQHVMRVAFACPLGDARIVGVLHDTVEDCEGWTTDRLRREGFSEAVLAGIDAVTRRPSEGYMAFIDQAAKDPLGRIVKRADLLDNMDATRLPEVTADDLSSIERYARALERLGA
jgi:(p)ppGpp synthase/HD superfamily hydrolase